jgi:hypothetical protein
MEQMELLADLLHRNLGFLNMTLADFSDADFFVRPCPGANHTAWQLGQVCTAERFFVGKYDPSFPPTPAGWDKKFTKETAGNDDHSFFPKKGELLADLAKVRSATVAWVKTLKPTDLSKPGPEQLKDFAPTLGRVIALVIDHTTMHVGQFQVIRRKLGKPILF